MIVDFLTEHKEVFGVEPICGVLSEHGCKIAPSTYYDVLDRQPSKRELCDQEVKKLITRVREHRFARSFGAQIDVAVAA